jgi:hypothetical protein
MAKSKIEKCQELFPDFVSEVDSMGVDTLDQRLLAYAKELESVKNSEQEDLEDMSEKGLGYAKELVKDRSAPYRDAKGHISLKMTYLVHLIKEKGGK